MAAAVLPALDTKALVSRRKASISYNTHSKGGNNKTTLDDLLARPSSGAYNDFILMFDKSCPESKVWYMMLDQTSKHPKPLPKISIAEMTKLKDIYGYRAVVQDNKLFILGGRHLQSGSYLAHCNRYDPKSKTWTRRASMLRGRTRFAAVVMDNCIYICGGEGRNGRLLASVECYDPVNNFWVEMHPMPRPRADLAACVADNKIFVSGGIGRRESSHRSRGGTPSFWHFDPYKDHWAVSYTKSNLPWTKERHSMVAYKGSIFVLGGIAYKKFIGDRQFSEGEDEAMMSFPVDKSQVIDMRISGTWNVGLPPMPVPRASFATLTVGHNIFAIGGRSVTEKKPSPVVQYYNVRKHRWYHAFDLPPEMGTFVNMDVVMLRVPITNKDFSPLAKATNDKWPLW